MNDFRQNLWSGGNRSWTQSFGLFQPFLVQSWSMICFLIAESKNNSPNDHFMTTQEVNMMTPDSLFQGEFCTHMLQEYQEMEEAVRRSKQVAFVLPATMNAFGHGIPVINIYPIRDGTVITVREDGFVCQWSPELKPQRTKHMFVCLYTWTFLVFHCWLMVPTEKDV